MAGRSNEKRTERTKGQKVQEANPDVMPDVSNQQSRRLPMDVYKQTPLQSCTFDEDLWSKPKEPLWSHAHYVPVCD